MQIPTKFEIKGLFGDRDVELDIKGEALILVGPNGIGKSSVSNIFYFFISRQWTRLTHYDFKEVVLWFGDVEIRAARSDITGLSQLTRALDQTSPSSRVNMLIERLRSTEMLEEFISKQRMGLRERERFAAAMQVSADEVRHLHFTLTRRMASLGEDELFLAPRLNIEQQLTRMLPNRTIYLPTYRRIEKDLQEIFPNLEERLRNAASPHSNLPFNFTRSAQHYVDLVSFGMEDVRFNLEHKTRQLRDYSLARFNELSGLYLRDVIKGTADQYSPQQITSLDEGLLSTILGRVSEQVLNSDDKAGLRKKIVDIKGKKKKDMEVNDLYLAHYFGRLMTASAEISEQETEILSFVDVCNAYLAPGKMIIYDDTNFSVKIVDDRGRDIDLSVLSSGEKQVVSLFSHLYLDDAKDQIVIIDEPELSLSVPWQKRFLTDILESHHCSFIFAVTHSPFIYQNNLRNCAVDLRRHITNSSPD